MCLNLFLDFFTSISKSLKIKDMKINIAMMLIANMRILNGLEHELRA